MGNTKGHQVISASTFIVLVMGLLGSSSLFAQTRADAWEGREQRREVEARRKEAPGFVITGAKIESIDKVGEDFIAKVSGRAYARGHIMSEVMPQPIQIKIPSDFLPLMTAGMNKPKSKDTSQDLSVSCDIVGDSCVLENANIQVNIRRSL